MERQQNEFNMAVSYLGRLNTLFYAADEAAISLDIYTWFHSLFAIFRELSTEMKEAEINELNKEFDSLSNLVNKSIKNQSKTGIAKINPEIISNLHNKEIRLRRVMKEAGLQNRTVEDYDEPTAW